MIYIQKTSMKHQVAIKMYKEPQNQQILHHKFPKTNIKCHCTKPQNRQLNTHKNMPMSILQVGLFVFVQILNSWR